MSPNNQPLTFNWKPAVRESLVSERDEAQEAISQIYFIVFGQAAEWSNLYGIANAVEDITDAVNALKIANLKNTAANVTLSGLLGLLEYDEHGIPCEYPKKKFVDIALKP